MVNWDKGLTKEQEETLETLKKTEESIPVMKHTLVDNSGSELVIIGKKLTQNKLIRHRDSGYTLYFETENFGLETFSSFNWTLKESEEL